MEVNRLRKLREEAILTVRELADRSGVSEDTITKLEHGHRNARPSTIRKLANALDVEPQELRRAAEPAVPLADDPEEAGSSEVRVELKAARLTLEPRPLKLMVMGVLQRVARGELSPEEAQPLIEEMYTAA